MASESAYLLWDCLLKIFKSQPINSQRHDCVAMCWNSSTVVDTLRRMDGSPGGLCPTQRTTNKKEIAREEEIVFPREDHPIFK